jgi:hypothetical protein
MPRVTGLPASAGFVPSAVVATGGLGHRIREFEDFANGVMDHDEPLDPAAPSTPPPLIANAEQAQPQTG